MSVKAKITDDMKAAMKAREVQRLSAIRLLLAAIQQREVDERKELSDAEVASVIEKMIKQRRDSIAQFQAAGRQDLVEKETFELNLLSGYLPKQLTDAEIGSEIAAAIVQTGAKGAADMGPVSPFIAARLPARRSVAARFGRDPRFVQARTAPSDRHRRRDRALRAAEKERRQPSRLLPVPQREDALVHRKPGQAVLPLLRLRCARQRHLLSHGVPGPRLRRSGEGPRRVCRHENARVRAARK